MAREAASPGAQGARLSQLEKGLSAPFQAGFVPARAWLFRRGLYLLLAFDAWLVMVEHGGRYGAGGFNVAHFAWLDALLPVPSAALYIGGLVAIGLAAITMALLQVGRAAKLALACAYTLSWAISLHDSYQHHYLLSWLLLWAVFIPEVSTRELREPAPAPALGLSLSAFTCAIVYAFTAVAKAAPNWRSGEVLARLSGSQPPGAPNPGVLDPVRDLLMATFDVDAAQAFRWIASSVIALQVCVAVGYSAAPGRDVGARKVRAVLCSVALMGAASFHVGAELTGMFKIGWFSYYMLWIAFVLLAPAAWVSWLARQVSAVAVGAERATAHLAPRPRSLWLALGLLVGAAAWLGAYVDVPGGLAACVGMAGLAVLTCGYFVRRGQSERVQPLIAACAIAGVSCLLCLTQTEVRFHLYRRWAGEVARLGESALALELYRKAERYAPPGQTRAHKIRELERKLQSE